MNMKRLEKYNFKNKVIALLSFLFVLAFSSCEETVNLDLETGPTRIVVDAEIIWLKETSGNEQTIKISKTAPFYNKTTPKVSGAQVRIENSEGEVFTFNESEPGLYVCKNFIPVINMNYTLYVTAEGQSFTAVEKLTSVTPLEKVEQETVPDIGGEDIIEVIYYYKDPEDQENYYLADYKTDFLLFPEYNLIDDEFSNGNEMNSRLSNDKIKPGKTVHITNRGISMGFYNYMNLLLEIYGGSPFAIPPGNIRGNIVNTTNPDNFAFGYFRLCEADKVSYVVK